jgi:hypothetical protein
MTIGERREWALRGADKTLQKIEDDASADPPLGKRAVIALMLDLAHHIGYREAKGLTPEGTEFP